MQYINSKKQKPKLIDSGHRFINDKSNETAVYWKCDKSKSFICRAHLNTDGENIIKGIGDHNHAANVAGLQVAQVVNSAKTWATSNSNGILAVFMLLPSKSEETYSQLFAQVKRLVPAAVPQSIMTDFKPAAINTI